jgi:hypothetical protein
MFIKSLALLLFNVFTCLSVLWCCRSLHSNHGCKGWKRAKEVKLCSLPLRSSAQRAIKRTVLEPKAYDRAHASSTRVSRFALAAIASILAPWNFWGSYERSSVPSTIDHIHACARAQCLRSSEPMWPGSTLVFYK